MLLATAVLLFSTLGLVAKPTPPSCRVHPPKGASRSQLKALARVSEDEARKAALGSLRKPAGATVEAAELESEHGCLVWSFDIRLAGKAGVQEVQIDAGDGKLISSAQESSQAEQAEKSKDKAKP